MFLTGGGDEEAVRSYSERTQGRAAG